MLVFASSCTLVGSDSEELFTTSQDTAAEAGGNQPVAGYYSGVVPWELAGQGVVPVGVIPQAELTPGDGKAAASLAHVPFTAPEDGGKGASALSDGMEYYHSANVAPSIVQGVTFEPAEGTAFACFELSAGDSCHTVGLAWYSLPSEPDGYFVGIGDRQLDAWHWYYGPDDGVLTFDPALWGTDVGDTLLVCVALEGGLPADFWQLKSGVSEVRGTGLVYEDPAQFVLEDRAASSRRVSSLPATVDLRPFAPPIANQGSMGSCTAFGIGDSAYNIMLSQLYAQYGWIVSDDANRASPMWCYVKSGMSPFGNWNPLCGASVGRYMSQPFNLLRDLGSATEETVPYYATENCGTTFPDDAYTEAAHLMIDSWAALSSYGMVDSIKEQLATYGRPVPIAMYGLESGFLYYSGGVYHYGGTPGVNGGHAMCIVGYDDDLQAFDVRNSWGGGWGLGGYWWCGYDAVTDLSALSRFSAYYMTASEDSGAVEYFLGGEIVEYDEQEPNDTRQQASSLPVFPFSEYSAHLDANDLHDYFSFAYAENSNTTITIGYGGSGLSPSATLYASDGTALAVATDTGSQLIISGVWSAGGTAFVGVFNQTGATGAYSVSGSVTVPPGAPTGVSATDGTLVEGVGVSWNAVAGATSYTVQRGLSAAGPYTEIGTVVGETMLDQGAELWQEYWYRVLADSDAGTSAPSSADSGYTGIPAPEGVSASDGLYDDRITVSWTESGPGLTYLVQRGLRPDGPFTALGEYDAAPVTDAEVVSGVVYYYVVCCTHDGLKGPLSQPDTGYVPLPSSDVTLTVDNGGSQSPLVEGGGLVESGDGKIQVLP